MGQSYVTSGKHEVIRPFFESLQLASCLIFYAYFFSLQSGCFGWMSLTFFINQETPEVFDLPTKVPIVKAAAGWAHCVAVTGCMPTCTFCLYLVEYFTCHTRKKVEHLN